MKLDPKGIEEAVHSWFAATSEEETVAMTDAISAYLKATNSVIVPVEPTQKMLISGAASLRDFFNPGPYPRTKAMFNAMIQASQENDNA